MNRQKVQRGIPPMDVKELKLTMLSHPRRLKKSPARVRARFNNRHIEASHTETLQHQQTGLAPESIVVLTQ